MRVRDMWIEEVARTEFITQRWQYAAGDHVTFIAPTQSGKTTLSMQLLEHTIHPRLPVFAMAGKKRDKPMTLFTKAMGLRLVRQWPPPIPHSVADLWRGKPNGWTIWPPHTGNEDIDDPLHADTFRRVMRHCANKGNCIILADEFGELKELGLDKTTRAIHRRGSSHGCGLWGSVQGTVYNETSAYSQAAHLFMGNVTDAAHRKRLGEIGAGIDPKLIEEACAMLPDFHWLYIRRRGRRVCIVGP